MTYFITVCAHMHRNLFQRRENAALLVKTLFRYRDACEFALHEYVIMPDHIHAILTVAENSSIGRAVQMIKGGFSHELHKAGIPSGTVWQPRYHDRRVRDLNEYAELALYVRNNPVRRGLAAASAEYEFSSAANLGQLDPMPAGLKPLREINEHASLKAGSTKFSKTQDADLKVSSTDHSLQERLATAKTNSVDGRELERADRKIDSTELTYVLS